MVEDEAHITLLAIFAASICSALAKRKLFKFAQIKSFDNVKENPFDLKGNWASFFGNNNPITLELACGKGDYTLGLARRNPDRNFIGVDVKGDRIWKGAGIAKEEGLSNVGFARIMIEHLTEFFAPGEVEEIWITFPDPHLPKGKTKKRLTHPRFLNLYHQVLQPGGLVKLKTDSDQLYAYTQEIIDELNLKVEENIQDVHGTLPEEHLLRQVRTYYERIWLKEGLTIHFIAFHPAP